MRFVPYKQQIRDADSDQFLGVLNTAFRIRESDKGGLSVTWVEHYGARCQATYEIAASRFRDALASKKLPKLSYFAVGSAGETKAKSSEHGKQIRIIHAPDGPNTGHAEVHRFSDDDRRLLDALATDVFCEHVAVVGLALD